MSRDWSNHQGCHETNANCDDESDDGLAHLKPPDRSNASQPSELTPAAYSADVVWQRLGIVSIEFRA